MINKRKRNLKIKRQKLLKRNKQIRRLKSLCKEMNKISINCIFQVNFNIEDYNIEIESNNMSCCESLENFDTEYWYTSD